MAKINCSINLMEDDKVIIDNKQVIGIKSYNKITFKDDNITVTILIEDNKIIMKRISNEYQLILEFEDKKDTHGKYFLNNYNLWLPLDIFTDKIVVSENNIEINYYLDKTNFNFKIKFEVIE